MTRIATYGSNQLYLSRVMEVQRRLDLRTTQVLSEKKSQNYTGIATDANRLINFENEKSRADAFKTNNESVQTRLQYTSTALSAIESSIKNFRDQLQEFKTNENRNDQDIKNIQNWAFNAMVAMQTDLNESLDGEFLFAGGKVSTQPVSLPAGSLESFQSLFDGFSVTYPTTRAATLLDRTTSTTNTGNLTFSAANGTITAATAGSLSAFPAGSRITVAGASANNNQDYTVVSNTGTAIKVSRLTTEGPTAGTVSWYPSGSHDQQTLAANLTFAPGADTITVSNATGFSVGQVFTVSGTAGNDGTYEVGSIAAGPPDTITISSVKVGTTETVAATLTSTSWYKGDTINTEHRIDEGRTVELGIFASDPAFEKAFRAMGLIAQGAFGTAGGLENNLDRVEQALFLVKDALDNPAGISPPFGTEMSSDMLSVQSQLGVTMNEITSKIESQKLFSGFLAERIIGLENVDKNEAVALLLDDQRALEASYQTLSKVRSMSLLNFLQ